MLQLQCERMQCLHPYYVSSPSISFQTVPAHVIGRMAQNVNVTCSLMEVGVVTIQVTSGSLTTVSSLQHYFSEFKVVSLVFKSLQLTGTISQRLVNVIIRRLNSRSSMVLFVTYSLTQLQIRSYMGRSLFLWWIRFNVSLDQLLSTNSENCALQRRFHQTLRTDEV
jgi:hypothetical protein